LRVLYAIATLWFFLIAGCAKAPPPGPGPEAVAQVYLAALKAGDYQACYRMIAENDLVHGSLGGFLGQIPMSPNVERRWFGQIEAATAYRFGTAMERGGEAAVPVNVTTPNLVLWERMLGARNATKQAVQKGFEKQLADGDYPSLSYPDQIVMVLEDGEWRILAGFAQRARIDRLHEQALAAYHQLDYDKALVLYRQMLERLDKAPFTASGEVAYLLSQEMKRVEAASAGAAAAQSYLTKLTLKNTDAKPALSGGPGMFGQLVNSGDRDLDQVELTVSYYSDTGKLVYAERHTPVALPLEFTDFDVPIVPMRPGETRDIGITLTAPLEIQQQNKPRMTVSGVIFSEPLATPPKLAGMGARIDARARDRDRAISAAASAGAKQK
jgi:tetratricopeptide (TPR) repeat protein